MRIDKNKTVKLLAITIVVMLMVNCSSDILDQVPKESLTEETVWTDPAGATQFVNGIYGEMQSGFDRNYDWWARGLYILDGASDDADVGMGWTHSTLLQNGEFTPDYVPWGNMWTIYYGLARRANVALENLDRLGEGEAELRDRLKGETYFLRGMIYHELLRLFGYRSPGTGENATGVPLIDKSLTLEDDLQIPRASYQEVVDFIVDDLDMAASLLPAKGEIEAGRATWGAAIALKSRVLLYDEQWGDAADAANEVIMSGHYSLFPDYRTLFLTRNNQEVIFAKKFSYPDKYHQSGGGGTQNAGWDVYNSPPSYRGPSDGGWGGNLPTQNFVGSYETVNGDPQTTTYPTSQNPWTNLDPRFEATVVHDGAMFRGKQVELFEGGIEAEFNTTGYFTRKFHDETLIPLYSRASDQDWIFMRYAEVLLNYAEAKNEASGPDGTVYDAINAIRARPNVNMPPLPTGLNQAEMRAKIRNERRIELAFEEHRFFDIRRWGIAENLLNGPLKGMEITRSGTAGNYTYSYNVVDFEQRQFPTKLYVLPIPQGEYDKNPEAEQILGW